MKRVALVAALAVLVWAASGCRINRLAEYMPNIKSAAVVSFTTGSPGVWIGSSGQSNPIAQAAADLAAIGMSQGLEARVTKAAPPERVQQVMTEEFTQGVSQGFTFQVVEEDQPHDTLIEVNVGSYGLSASSLQSALYYTLTATSTIVYVPENRVIWETTERYSVPITPVLLWGPGSRVANTGINLAMIAQLDDDQLGQMFDRLAVEGAQLVLRRMRRDAHHR
jgi:hypothetical protein